MVVSIIIPTYNRSGQLDLTLKGLTAIKTDPSLFEIIVIDNGSTDNTPDIVKGYQAQHSNLNISYYYDAVPGLLTGRHRGAKEAKGEILTFIDDDVVVSSTWLDTIMNVMQSRNDISFITGPNMPLYEAYPPAWLQYFWTSTPYGGKMCTWLSLLDLGDKPIEISPYYVFGLNFTIRKTDFIELGGFHPDNIAPKFQMYQGDGETGLAAKGVENNKKALYHPGVLLYHQTPAARLTFDYFDRRAYYQGVCNSFTDIRTNAGLYTKPHADTQSNTTANASGLLRTLASKFQKKKEPQLPEEIVALFARFGKQEYDGHQFHQNAFNTNALVKEWCLRKDYFNYKLPE